MYIPDAVAYCIHILYPAVCQPSRTVHSPPAYCMHAMEIHGDILYGGFMDKK